MSRLMRALELLALLVVLVSLLTTAWYLDSLHDRIDILEEQVIDLQVEACPSP